ncbi:MAG: helix-turn-helix transcriptional regulator [Nitrososphaerota archaeon]|jgi:DNA-binding HxlR family transcriptional regulator|nr:helix-turn-helix transcriptional regulator [Nitrososphaerota archaeon]
MSGKSSQDVCMCALDGTMDLLGKKWALFTINAIGNHGSVRFKDLYGELRGVSPSTLSSILRQLESRGIVNRKSYAEIPPRVEYSLTENGARLREAILPLLVWASRQDDYSKQAEECDPAQYVRVALPGQQ